MYFKLSKGQEIDLLNQPETGMGYQVVEATKAWNYNREKFLVLNSEVVIEMNGFEDDFIRSIFSQGIICKFMDDDPIERYALPNNDELKFAFYIMPVKSDTLQKGRVLPANGKQGGGKEVYFSKGTTQGTFFKQTPY